ncbi:MAG: DUF1284 domain-containing protein [Clostridium sp.]
MINLRAHHINCLFFYRGIGYDKDFTVNMNTVKDTIIKNPLTTFKLINKCDVLCSKCPNKLSSNLCKSNKKVLELDIKTLKSYNLEVNKLYDFQFIIENIYKDFDNNKFKEICKSCEWYQKGTCSCNLINDQKQLWSL